MFNPDPLAGGKFLSNPFIDSRQTSKKIFSFPSNDPTATLSLIDARRSKRVSRGSRNRRQDKSRLLARDYAGLRSDWEGVQIQNLYVQGGVRRAHAQFSLLVPSWPSVSAGREIKTRSNAVGQGGKEGRKERRKEGECKKIPTRAHC